MVCCIQNGQPNKKNEFDWLKVSMKNIAGLSVSVRNFAVENIVNMREAGTIIRTLLRTLQV